MTDCFFSYKSDDRERVRPVKDALNNMGFDIFWDQEVPPGTDWDSWIKLELQKCRSAVVFWSANSIRSANVRQEATIAHNAGKLIQVLLAPLTPEQFPMGLYTTQAVNLIDWSGKPEDENWLKLTRELEARVAPRWMRSRLLLLEDQVKAEQAKREISELRETNLQQKLAEELAARKVASLEADEARASTEPLISAVEGLKESKRLAETSVVTVERRLASVLASIDNLQDRTDAMLKPQPAWRSSGVHLLAGAVAGCLMLGIFLSLSPWATGPAAHKEPAADAQTIRDLRAQIGILKTNLAIAEITTERLKGLQSENFDLTKKLEIQKSLVETNWVDAICGLKAAYTKIGGEDAEAAGKR